MKLFLLLVLIATSIVSCSSESGKLLDGTKRAMVKELYFSDVTYVLEPLPHLQARNIDTIYQVGDTMLVNGTYYIVAR
jgi:hypothetical protein